MKIRLFALIVMLFAAVPAFAALSITPTTLPSIDLVAWAGTTDDLEGATSVCVVSTKKNGRGKKYRLRAYANTPASTAGEFPIINSTGDRMNITFTVEHPNQGAIVMQDFTSTGFQTGQLDGAANCADAVSQVTLRLTLPAAELLTAQAGTYTGTFALEARQGGAASTGQLSFQLTVPDMIQITGLANTLTIPNTTFTSAPSGFCVFRNAAAGFQITASGQNDSGGKFFLKDVDTLEYHIEFAQGGAYTEVSPGVPLTSASSGFFGSGTRDCGGATNTQVRLWVDSGQATTKDAGTYTDVITITVAP